MVGADKFDWEDELRGWLKPLLDRLAINRGGECVDYVAGLIGPGDRKSVQPMAERLAPGDYNKLHHFVAAGVRDAAAEASWCWAEYRTSRTGGHGAWRRLIA